jgi:hypothetical protein
MKRPGSVAMLTLGVGVLWCLLRALTGFDGLYGQDAHEYLRLAAAWLRALQGGPAPGPSFWPIGYPALAALLALGPWPLAATAQVLSGLAYVAACALGVATLQRLYPEHARAAACYWLATFALSPFVLRAALCIMSDVTALAWAGLFVYCAARWQRAPRLAWIAAGAAACVAAGTTRHATGAVLLPSIVWWAWRAWQQHAHTRPRLLFVSMVGALAAALPTVLAASGGALQPWHYPAVSGWSLGHAFALQQHTPDGYVVQRLPTALYAFSNVLNPGFTVLGPLLLLGLRARDLRAGLQRALAVGWLLYALFHVGVPYQHDRHLLASFPLALLVLFPAAQRLLAWARARLGTPRHALALLGALLFLALQLGLFARATRAVRAAARLERVVAQALRAYPATTLYTFWLTPALRTRAVPQQLVDLWEQGQLDARAGELVLFAPERFALQWARANPMRNWRALEAGFVLEPVERFDLGFTLYMLRARTTPQPRPAH